MGRPKLLLPWGKTTILGHLIRQWQDLDTGQIAVVCAAGDFVIGSELERLNFPAEQRIDNIDPERGMFSSIQSASQWSKWNSGLSHFVIVLGDQPHLSSETLREIIEFGLAHPEHICVPRQGGHRRHPVWFPRGAFQQLAGSAKQDLRDFLNNAPVPVALCEIADPAFEVDIDRPEDYERATRCYLKDGQAAS